MSKEYQDLHSLDPQEEGTYKSAYNFSRAGFSLPSPSRHSGLLFGLFALCALMLTILIIVVAVSNSSVKETQKKQEQSLSNFSQFVQSDFQAVRSEEGSMQEKLNTMEAALKKLEADKSIDSTSNCCPDEWVGFAGSCYFFSKTGRSWDDSKKFCASLSMSAYLVVINTDAEQQFLQTKTIPAYTWIGLTDVDGTWTWVDGTNYETTPKQWIPGQPDEYFGHGLGGGEDCAHMHHQGQWNDEHCSRLYNAVCEKKMLESL